MVQLSISDPGLLHQMKRSRHTILPFLSMAVVFLNGCAVTNSMPPPVHQTAIEQFLLTQSVEMALNGEENPSLPLPAGESLFLEVSGLTVNKTYVKDVVTRWLGEQGFRVQSESDNPSYKVIILVEGLGTEQSQSFFGFPPVQSAFIPFALPELPIYKAQYQKGYTRFRLDIYERESDQFVRSTPWYQHATYFHEYTLLFFIGFHRTNLAGPVNPASQR